MTNLFASKTTPNGSMTQRLEQKLCELSRRRVLFVDDEPMATNLMQRFMEEYFNAELTVTDSVKGTLTLLREIEVKPFDLIILDVRLSNGTGVQIYREIFPKWPTMPVIFLTGFAGEDVRKQVAAIGPALVYDKNQFMKAEFLTPLLEQLGLRRKNT
jgi:DNA-binding NarL/FixJ family response regulator